MKKKNCWLAFLVIILGASFLFVGAIQTAAQELQGMMPEAGTLTPDTELSVASGGETYFVQRDAKKAIRELNDLHQLELTESEIEQLAERLEKEVYPRYPGPFPELREYLMDVNDTLGLGLSAEQIDMQLEEASKPRRPEDFEIPPRPPSDTIFEVIGRVPSDESAPYFIGTNGLIVFYVNDAATTNAWTTAEKNTAGARVGESINWFLAKDTADFISSANWYYYWSSHTVNFTNSCSNTWMDQIATNLGWADLEALLRGVRDYLGLDYIVALFLISEDARSQACPYIPEWGGAYGHWDERTIIFGYETVGGALTMADAGVYKHETLHLYGACDEYNSSQCNTGCGECLIAYPDFRPTFLNQFNCEYCTTDYVSCVMRSGAHGSTLNNDICLWSMGQVGWVCAATAAAANSSLEPYLPLLREFRDRYLLADNNFIGRKFVQLYYRAAPMMVDLMARHKIVKTMMRAGLAPVVLVSAFFVKTTTVQKLIISFSLLGLGCATIIMWKRRKIWALSTMPRCRGSVF